MKRLLLSRFARNYGYTLRKNSILSPASEVEVKYPDLFDTSPEGKEAQKRKYTYEKIKRIPTVDRKLFEISKNVSKCYIIKKSVSRVNALDFNLVCTNSHLIKELPQPVQKLYDQTYDNLMPIFFESIESEIKKPTFVEDVIETFQKDKYQPLKTQSAINKVLSHFLPILSQKMQHISDLKMIWNPRNDAYWWHKDFSIKPYKRLNKNSLFQYQDEACVQLRINTPLKPYTYDSSPYTNREVPDYYKRAKGFFHHYEYRHVTCSPGMWPSLDPTRPHDCALLSIHTTEFLKDHKRLLFEMNEQDMIDAAAVISSFAWGTALANYHGFTAVNEVTYPFVIPSIFTDGHTWNFYLYQLNSMGFHSDVFDLEKTKPNICWSSGSLDLYAPNGSNDSGQAPRKFNEEVFKYFMAFLTHPLMDTSTVTLRPYLREDTRDPETKLEDYKHWRELCANRPHWNFQLREIPLWRKIYKQKYNPLVPRNDWIKEF